MQSVTLRQQFINYYRDNDHKYLKPSNVFINDPTLMFVNAGMNQLKNVFLGEKYDEKYNKLVNSQICIRAGGKHNDFDDVGKDSYHLTCFEMLGNWSLSAYSKEKAIDLAFNFLIHHCHLNIEQMYVTYFMGDNKIPEDLETFHIWKKYLPEHKIIKGFPKDNFWKMADTGPCGVCTEIHYDLIDNRSVPELVNTDDPEVVEIWNIVFIQYNQIGDDYLPLSKSYIDTGMGMERLSMILQRKKSIYETDCFRYLMGWAQVLSNGDFYTNQYDNNIDMSYRIFADHIRTSIISIHQGINFDAHGRGFVLRKIFRRLLVHYYVYLAKGLISQIMNRQEIKLIISQVLNYFLINTFNDEIQNKLIEEEKIAIGKWSNIKSKYNRYLKTLDHEKACEKLKSTDGIDIELIKNINILKVIQI